MNRTTNITVLPPWQLSQQVKQNKIKKGEKAAYETEQEHCYFQKELYYDVIGGVSTYCEMYNTITKTVLYCRFGSMKI